MSAVRNLPHIFLGTPIRCCMQCSGQTRAPWPAPMVHEATCRMMKKATPTYAPPPDWRDRVAEREAE